MEILSSKYPGIWFICEQCGALIGNVKDNEIYNDNDVYCPCCKFKNTLSLNGTAMAGFNIEGMTAV